MRCCLPAEASYPALTPLIGSAFWYEREIHDLFGIVPDGHPRLEPLVLPTASDVLPRPGASWAPASIDPDPGVLPRHVVGPGLFTIPHGPVRSGVVESIEYLVETPGEDIPHLNMRLFYKHRGIESAVRRAWARPTVCCLPSGPRASPSVAHAMAYCQAIERIAGAQVPWTASLVRVLHAELERLACHLDVIVRLADGAGLAVATARFGWHKEMVLRLTGQLSGSRFGRGVVVPGGVSAAPLGPPADVLAAVGVLDRQITADVEAADGHRILPGPAAPDRPAASQSGLRSMVRSDPSGERRATPTTPGNRGPTPLTAPWAWRSLAVRTATRWPGSRYALTRSPVPFTCCAKRPTSLPRPLPGHSRSGCQPV